MADLLFSHNKRRITVTLASDERDALWKLAFQDRRDIRQQAALLIRHELERRGLLAAVNDPAEVSHETD